MSKRIPKNQIKDEVKPVEREVRINKPKSKPAIVEPLEKKEEIIKKTKMEQALECWRKSREFYKAGNYADALKYQEYAEGMGLESNSTYEQYKGWCRDYIEKRGNTLWVKK